MTMDLDEKARAILRANDRGGYTVPTARLYPFQWNWDSAFCALGFATFDHERAWREVETLVEGQWEDGMIPHIVFRRPDPDYFPGPEAWGTGGRHPEGMPTSGISQPPVLASVLNALYHATGDAERARPLMQACWRSHRWWHAARLDPASGLDPAARGGVVSVVHPWESGRDNCPDWDAALDRVPVDPDLPAYTRRDTGHVGAEQRPNQAQYDRYMSIVKFGADHGWSADALRERGPFRVADPGCHFMLLEAESSLLHLSRLVDPEHGPEREEEVGDRIQTLELGADALWNEAAGAWTALDMRTGARSDAVSSASMLAFWAPWARANRRRRLLETFDGMIGAARFAVPSSDPRGTAFEAARYWRGPVWAVINYMIALGLRAENQDALANRVRDDTRALIEGAGFYEYFDPLTGEGLGGADFSWTAAMWLYWCGPNATLSAEPSPNHEMRRSKAAKRERERAGHAAETEGLRTRERAAAEPKGT